MALPPPPPPPGSAAAFAAQVEEDIRNGEARRWMRRRGVEEDSQETSETEEEEDDNDPPTPSRSSSSPSPNKHDLTLSNLLTLAEAHKEAALMKKERKERRKRSEDSSEDEEAAVLSPPPTTPASKMGRLRVRSSTGVKTSQTSPLKRRRGSSPTPSSSPSPSVQAPSPSPSPSKRAARNVGKTRRTATALLGLTLSLAGAVSPPSTPPLVATISRLCQEIPDLTLPELVDVSQALRLGTPLLAAAAERAPSTSRVLGPSFNLLSRTVISPLSSAPARAKQPFAALLLSRALEIYPPASDADAAFSPAIPLPPPPRILSTRHSLCIQCSSPLVLRPHRASDSALLLEPSSPAVPAIVAVHSCSVCSAIHAPDHVELLQSGVRLWLWDPDAPAMKVGERVWVTAGFARQARALLLGQAVSPGGFAEMWEGLYGAKRDQGSEEEDEGELSEEEEREEKEDDQDPFRSPSTPRRTSPSSRPFRLRASHVWRSIVLLCCFTSLPPPVNAFATLSRPSTADLVRLANRDLFNGGEQASEACVLEPHSCGVCTRERRVWKKGPASEAEKSNGVKWAGTHAKAAEGFVEHTTLVDGPPVSLAVLDGIQIGHPLCAYPFCPNPPEKHRRTRRFCTSHLSQHTLCGVLGCGRERSYELDGHGDLTEACEMEAHQELWRDWARKKREYEGKGWAGRRRKVGEGVMKYEVVGAVEDTEEEEERDVKPFVEGDGSDGEDEDWEEKAKPSPRVVTTWSLRRTTNLQLLVSACGCPLAWSKFSSGETSSAIISFLSSVYSQQSDSVSFPSYIAYDRACHILRSLASPADFSSSFPSFLRDSRLIVTAFHRQSHPADDALCEEFCNPTPLDGRAPDLVVPFREKRKRRDGKKRERTFERAFNTTAAEQLNSTLSRFAPLLSTMRADNFDFLVHVLLRHRREKAEERVRWEEVKRRAK
ncbi:hypothetical protein JCM10213_008671 [Rhodosporidiobolus nylandii]